jgi:DNA polymerase elongation subunit (family B)
MRCRRSRLRLGVQRRGVTVGELADALNPRLRVLVVDIETAPHLAHVWGLWDQNVGLSQIADVGHVLCWAAKWVGERDVEYRSEHHDGHEAMVRRAWELFNDADAVVGYNSRSFDVKHLRREFVLAGLTPPSPHKDIDLITTCRTQFKFASNKLEHVASELGLGHKVKHSGFELWLGCLRGDEAAWREMRRYNIQDVKLTEKLYLRLLPWIKNHPHHGLYLAEHRPVCQNCGGNDLQRRGHSQTTLGRYQRFHCGTCGAWSRGRHSDRQMGTRVI